MHRGSGSWDDADAGSNPWIPVCGTPRLHGGSDSEGRPPPLVSASGDQIWLPFEDCAAGDSSSFSGEWDDELFPLLKGDESLLGFPSCGFVENGSAPDPPPMAALALSTAR